MSLYARVSIYPKPRMFVSTSVCAHVPLVVSFSLASGNASNDQSNGSGQAMLSLTVVKQW